MPSGVSILGDVFYGCHQVYGLMLVINFVINMSSSFMFNVLLVFRCLLVLHI